MIKARRDGSTGTKLMRCGIAVSSTGQSEET